MSPCRQKGLLLFGVSISPPFSFQIYVNCSPLTYGGEQFTIKLLDIDERSCSAISGCGVEVPSETLRRSLQNCIRAGPRHVNTSVLGRPVKTDVGRAMRTG